MKAQNCSVLPLLMPVPLGFKTVQQRVSLQQELFLELLCSMHILNVCEEQNMENKGTRYVRNPSADVGCVSKGLLFPVALCGSFFSALIVWCICLCALVPVW